MKKECTIVGVGDVAPGSKLHKTMIVRQYLYCTRTIEACNEILESVKRKIIINPSK